MTGSALETPKSQHGSMKLKRGNWTKISILVIKPLAEQNSDSVAVKEMGLVKKADSWKLFSSDGRVSLFRTDSLIHFRNCSMSDQTINVDQD